MTLDDIGLAIEWLRSYESAPGDDGQERCERVAAFLEAERQRRANASVSAAAIRQIAAELHVSPTAIRAQLASKRRQARAKGAPR